MKIRKIVLYILLALLSFQMAVVGSFKVLAADPFLSNMKALHYSTGFTIFLGAVEVLGAIGLWIPRFRNLALVGLLLIMPGAIAAHISGSQPVNTIGGAVVSSLVIIAALCLNSAPQLKALFFGDTSQRVKQNDQIRTASAGMDPAIS